MRSKSAIGIFDSGIGGLTVVKAVLEALPKEDIIYFGDTARVPYGIKSVETVREYANQIVDFLIAEKVKLIIIACNTVSAAAEEILIEKCKEFDIPVLGVIDAGSRAALKSESAHRIGVIGTLATVSSSAYEASIKQKRENAIVYSKACPLLVPIAEEGWADTKIAEDTLEIYLESFKEKQLDTLILGCTHYPLFKKSIAKVLNDSTINIVDSADSVAERAKEVLFEKELLNENGGNFTCHVTDKPQRFQHLAELFLGKRISRVEIISLN